MLTPIVLAFLPGATFALMYRTVLNGSIFGKRNSTDLNYLLFLPTMLANMTRIAKTYGVSMTPEKHRDIMGRINALGSRASSFSNYLTQLADGDLQYDLIGYIASKQHAIASDVTPPPGRVNKAASELLKLGTEQVRRVGRRTVEAAPPAKGARKK